MMHVEKFLVTNVCDEKFYQYLHSSIYINVGRFLAVITSMLREFTDFFFAKLWWWIRYLSDHSEYACQSDVPQSGNLFFVLANAFL